MSWGKTKEQVIREIWLNYFNSVLLKKGMITQQEYNRMKIKIQSQAR